MQSRRLPAQLAVIFLLFVVSFWIVQLALPEHLKEDLAFWTQFSAGSSWPAERPYSDGDPRFAIAVAIHFLLNFAPVLGVLALVWRLLVVGKREVDLRSLLELRDDTIRHEIFARLDASQRQALQGVIDAAIQEAAEIWEREHLTDILSAEKVKEILDQKYKLDQR